jgi:predicted dienelactone hydrolase
MVVGAGACLMSGPLRRIGWFFLTVSLVVAVAQGVLEGAHWQLLPAYAAIGLLCVVALRRGVESRRLQIVTISVALLFTAATVVFSFLLPMFRLPQPTGPYPVGTTILYFKDSARTDDASPVAGSPRELMVQLWYPAEPSDNRFATYRQQRETEPISSYQTVLPTNSRLNAPVAGVGGPFPVILFNHAWHGRRTNDTFLTEELASHGYVVASIDHTYNASVVSFPDGRVIHENTSHEIDDPESSTPVRIRTAWDKELEKWTVDQQFILDRLEAMDRSAGTPWFGRLETNMSGAIGHSFGGAAATQVCAEDRRVRAAVNMDGWFLGAIRVRGPSQPLLVIDASEPNAPPDPRAKVEELLDASDLADLEASFHKYGGYLLLVRGAAHEDFTDQALVSPLRMISHRGTVPAEQMQKIVRTYVLAFFDKMLRGKDSWILRANSSPYAEVSIEEWPVALNSASAAIGAK